MTGYATAHRSALLDGVLTQAQLTPYATALVWRDEEIGYGALLRRAERERARLAGLPGDEPVAVPAVKSPGTVALVLACLLERRPVLLPAATLGPDALDRLHEQAGVRHVLRPCDDPPPPGTDAPRPPAPSAGRPALLLTTSGSTGAPKIVPLDADAVDAFTGWAAEAFGIGPGTTVLNYAPLNFDLCLLDVWTTLAHGGRVVLVDPDHALDGPRLLGLLTRHQVRVVQAVPMFFRLLADAADAAGTVLPAVRHAMFTGDAVPGPLLARLPGLLPGARLHNIYGCTETNDSFVHEVPAAAAAGGGPLPLGRPLPGVDALVVTDEGTVLAGPGTGELLVSTPFQTRGYLGAAAAARVFVPHPARGGAPGRRYFRSGDLVRRHPDGSLTLQGRTDFQVKVRGVRVNAQEVEHVLLGHDEVTEAAVLALPDPVAGRLLHAVVRRAPGSGLNSLTLRGHLARRLPRAAVPSGLRIVDDPLPRTSTGKVDRDRVASAHFTKEN
ncbi:AMP-binding protein [Streptomyces sp. GESEQ-35]|uniref:AMP-binding protein n=1 Tax=Streptomyces sp. GESEQ-35 TaxID=2812657 RepID=UPI001B31EAE4|nr:AMP-binding protein [Streptomyces sp. GESEQ-35]